MRRTAFFLLVLPLIAGLLHGAEPAILSPQDRERIAALQGEISPEEMNKILVPFDKLDRISGGEGEARAAALLAGALTRYGVPHRVHRFRAYLSWPVRAELRVLAPEARTLKAVTPAFSASTGPDGLEGELLFVGSPGAIFGSLEAAYEGRDLRGKIVVADGLITPQHARLVEDLGAAGLVHINPRDLLHEMIMTTVWGTPTPETARFIPKIPALSVGHSDGEWLKKLAERGPVRVHLVTEVSTRWREIPLVEAWVNGNEELFSRDENRQFILVSSHLDAWYAGMTDTASTDAGILEMARVLQRHREWLRRSVRFLWWTGHSTGRYAGSTWYADNSWIDLDANCVAYMNLDGPGARSVPLEEVAAWAWPELEDFTKQLARELTGMEPREGYFAGPMRIFRPFRAGDSAFQGIGVPEVSIGLPEIPPGHPDHAGYVGGSERGWWWHTPADSLDKIDMKALVRDTELRLAELYSLATSPVLPYRLSPIARSYRLALSDLQAASAPHFEGELAELAARAERLENLAQQIDTLVDDIRRQFAGQDIEGIEATALNRLLLRVAHQLNSTLYTASGRYEQDPAAPLPILPGLDPVRRLAVLDPESDEHGFLRTRLIRERNRVAATLDAASNSLEEFLETR
jgi:Iap family predicted aminopeptidase